MISIRKQLCLLIVLSALLAAASMGIAAQYTRQLAPGVMLVQDVRFESKPTLVVNCVTVDLGDPTVTVRAAIGEDRINTDGWAKGRETISALTARKDAVVGVNADFFPFTGDPLGVCVVDGDLVSEPEGRRVGLALTQDDKAFFDIGRLDAKVTLTTGVSRQIDGINRPRETNQLIAYTSVYGDSTQGKYKGTDVVLAPASDQPGTACLPVAIGKPMTLVVHEVREDALDTRIPAGGMVLSAGGPAAWFMKQNLKPGDGVTLRFDIKSATGADWSRVRQAVGGGPWLVRNGRADVGAEAEGFGTSFSTTLHPRTALGITRSGNLLIVTVDGRQAISSGISLPDLAALMMRLGAVDAINLDGGGSTTLAARGIVLNSPSSGEERPVANALIVQSTRKPAGDLPKLTITGAGPQAISGRGSQLFLTWGDDAQMLTPDQLSKVVWGSTNGVGFVNQAGYFTPFKARKGTVNAMFGAQKVSLDVTVVPAPASRIGIEATPDKANPARAAVKVTIYDENYNRLPAAAVTLSATGGSIDSSSGLTNDKGEFDTFVTWDPAAASRAIRGLSGEAALDKSFTEAAK